MQKLSDQLEVDILGDPHLGRSFKTGVPLHRMGEREASQMADLTLSLSNPKHLTHVCLGDLFDKFRVSNEVVLATATAYEAAALANPDVTYIVLQGNHDNSRDNEKVSSFAIFDRMVSHLANIHVLTGCSMYHEGCLYVPWLPFSSAEDILEASTQTIAGKFPNLKAVFAHWDVDNYGNDDAMHVVPVTLLKCMTDLVVLGHYHKPSEVTAKGLRIVTWGSMQPYAHGEEVEQNLYVSHSVSKVEANLEENENYYDSKCLRVLLDHNEKPLAGIECMALTHKRLDIPDSGNELDVSVDEFSLESVFKETFKELGVGSELTNLLFTKI